MQRPMQQQPQQQQMGGAWKDAQAKPHGWATEFLQYDEGQQDQQAKNSEAAELQRAADELLRQSDDPKVRNSIVSCN